MTVRVSDLALAFDTAKHLRAFELDKMRYIKALDVSRLSSALDTAAFTTHLDDAVRQVVAGAALTVRDFVEPSIALMTQTLTAPLVESFQRIADDVARSHLAEMQRIARSLTVPAELTESALRFAEYVRIPVPDVIEPWAVAEADDDGLTVLPGESPDAPRRIVEALEAAVDILRDLRSQQIEGEEMTSRRHRQILLMALVVGIVSQLVALLLQWARGQ